MNILIVDDEPIILSSIQEIILHSPFSGCPLLLAQDSATALTLLRTQKPDILLSDIQMPQMNGIELLQIIQEEQLDTDVIFITGYPDFQYAHSALKYNAFDYLLKPITADSLLPSLRRAVAARQEKEHTRNLSQTLSAFYKQNQHLLRRQSLENLLINPLADCSAVTDAQISELQIRQRHFCLIGIRCDLSTHHMLLHQEYYIAYTLSEAIFQTHKDCTSCYIGNMVYVLFPLGQPAQYTVAVTEFAASLDQLSREKYYTPLTFGISQLTDTYLDFPRLSYQVQQCLSFSQTLGEEDSVNAVFYDDIDDYNIRLFEINECTTQLINAIQLKNTIRAQQIVQRFFSLIRTESLERQQDALRLMELNLHCQLQSTLSDPVDVRYLTHPIDRFCMEAPCSEKSRDVFANCIANMIQDLSGVSLRHNNQLIQSIRDYINKNYARQIGLSDVSDYLGRNPSYISRLLNKELHKGFSQLLTERRMSAAKDLLTNTSYKIAEIAELSGYSSPKYFHQVFLSNTGMTPSDYRTIMKQF